MLLSQLRNHANVDETKVISVRKQTSSEGFPSFQSWSWSIRVYLFSPGAGLYVRIFFIPTTFLKLIQVDEGFLKMD